MLCILRDSIANDCPSWLKRLMLLSSLERADLIQQTWTRSQMKWRGIHDTPAQGLRWRGEEASTTHLNKVSDEEVSTTHLNKVSDEEVSTTHLNKVSDEEVSTTHLNTVSDEEVKRHPRHTWTRSQMKRWRGTCDKPGQGLRPRDEEAATTHLDKSQMKRWRGIHDTPGQGLRWRGEEASTTHLDKDSGDPPGWGSLESETVKCGHESRGTRTWEWLRWRGPAAIVNYRPMLSSEKLLHKDYNRKCSVGKIKLLVVSLKGLVAKASRKVTLTLNFQWRF
jgi:hypothetical protein